MKKLEKLYEKTTLVKKAEEFPKIPELSRHISNGSTQRQTGYWTHTSYLTDPFVTDSGYSIDTTEDGSAWGGLDTVSEHIKA